MLICCLAPVAALGDILFLDLQVGTTLLLALVLICPLSHVLMMLFMGRENACEIDRRTRHMAS